MGVQAKQASWPVVVIMILAVVLWLKDHKRDIFETIGGEERTSASDGRYERFEGCRWVENRRNDGDSFRVELPDGRVEELRLYFVDAPESAFKSYGKGRNNHERIEDQGRDLGVSPDRAVEIGVAAKRFVHDTLGKRDFTIFTEWDDPFGDRRYHAFVKMPSGAWLHETLVEKGLVRIHTKGADVPGGLRRAAQQGYLRELETLARSNKYGAWGG